MDSLKWLAEYNPAADENLRATGDTKVLTRYLRQAADEIERLRADLSTASSKLDKSQAALSEFVKAAKSWHECHHPIGYAATQCDWLCECIPAGEEALK